MKASPVWPSAPIGLIAEVTLGKMLRNTATRKENIELPYLHAANIRDRGVLSTKYSHRTMWFSEEETTRLSILEGDVVVAEGGAVGKSAYVSSNIDGYGFQNSILRIRANPKISDGRFIQYCLQSSFDRGEIAQACSTVSIPHFPAEKVNRFKIPFPLLTTQRRISDYLDQETAEIDAAVADLDRYVELLKLRSKKLIASYLEGDYPRVKMGLLAKSITGLTYRPEDVVDHDGIHVYRAGNIQDSRIDRSDMVSVNIEVPRHLRFRKGDILMCSTNGSAKLVGKNAMVEPYDYGQTWGAFMRVIRSELNPYLYWFFRSPLFDQYRGNFSTSTINQLTTGFLNQIPVPLPTESERDEIVSVLNEETLKIDQLIAESSKLRDLLLTRRSVLITDVVTGRKQV